MEFFIQALAENQYLRVLAEPNLVALSGEEASFLAGGEYPIPVVQGSSGGSTSVTIEYKQFGVQLRFRPTVLGDGRIRIFVAPEVSELSDVGAVVIQGFRIPSLATRKSSATLELKSGQTFGMAGLLSRSSAGTASRIPGIGDIPVLGALFRSVRYTSGETELVVLVTANLVEPLNTTPAVPGFGHKDPNDWELYGCAQLEGAGAARISASDAKWLKETGITRLKGPGAWATYEGPASHSQSTLKPTVGPLGRKAPVKAPPPAPAHAPAAASPKPAK
jgi:pilus assembly protein CpaC